MWTDGRHVISADSVPCAVVLYGDDGHLRLVNDPLIALLKLPGEGISGLHVEQLMTPASRVMHQMVVMPALKLQGCIDEMALTLRSTDGRDIHVMCSGVRRTEGDTAVNHCIWLPISERRKLDEELARMRRAADGLPGVMFQLQLDTENRGRFNFVSDRIHALCGLTPALLRDNASHFFDAIHPEDRESVMVAMRQAVKVGRAGHSEFRMLGAGNSPEKWVEAHATPHSNPDGRVVWNGYLSDVTRQRLLQERLIENDKLRLTAQLAAGVAHDFNNMLGSINGLAELCLYQAEEDSPLHRNLVHILATGERAAGLVRQLLNYARQTPQQLRTIALADWLMRCSTLLQAGLSPEVRIESVADADCSAAVDEVQLDHVLHNLVNNAAYAMRPHGGVIRLTLSSVAADASPLKVDSACIVVADTGHGIAPEDMSNIFQPFFTTKPVGDGTGLGLSSALGIVKAHGGKLLATSQPGAGSTFTVWLPVVTTAELTG